MSVQLSISHLQEVYITVEYYSAIVHLAKAAPSLSEKLQYGWTYMRDRKSTPYITSLKSVRPSISDLQHVYITLQHTSAVVHLAMTAPRLSERLQSGWGHMRGKKSLRDRRLQTAEIFVTSIRFNTLTLLVTWSLYIFFIDTSNWQMKRLYRIFIFFK